MKILPKYIVLSVLSLVLISCANNQSQPNIILFLVDDLGRTDLGCYGSDLYETPNIDKLASEGVKFTNAYSACTVCSPSRAAIMTGKYPARLHLTDWIQGHKRPKAKLKVSDWQMFLDTTEVTIADALSDAGYVTANFGKWHLGDEPLYCPENQGFDVNVGGYRWGAPGSYFYPYHGNRRDKIHPPNLQEGEKGEYLTDRLTDEALAFIENYAEESFFIYFPHYAVHTPIQAHDTLTKYYQSKVNENLQHQNAAYAAMIHSMDHSLGRIREKLLELGLDEKTAIFFTSDNGGLELRNITSNGAVRDGKGSAYEGGVRVPFIALVPGVTLKGSISDEPIIGMDLYPTILDLAGLEVVEHDGKNLIPLLNSTSSQLNRSSIFWHYPHYHPGGATPYSAIRNGDYKLIEFFEDGKLEMYNLADDIGETNSLAELRPAKLKELHEELKHWRDEIGAQYPSPNSDYVGVKTD